jgi:rhamnopyranosyl-N-acetylglucosaminyl-diphospho-decaprenol beta-1,3/1,4-galactofuranosyltransferase
MKICAVVPTHNRKEPLALCLEALLRQTRPLDEVLVIDNASTDGTGQMIAEKFPDKVTHVRLTENTGSAGGFATGMGLAHGHGHCWIWCMDDDAIPLDDALQKLLEADLGSEVPTVAKVCSRRDPITGQRFAAGEVLDFKTRTIMAVDQTDWAGKTVAIDCAAWAGLLVNAEAAHEVGYGKAGLFAWLDDYVFTAELRRFGRILHVGNATIFHHLPGETFPGVEKHGSRRIIIGDYWKMYYLLRNTFFWRSLCFGKSRTIARQAMLYFRYLAGVLIFDDFKWYRMRILTKAFGDALTGRLGRRVEPGDFRKRFGVANGPTTPAKSPAKAERQT